MLQNTFVVLLAHGSTDPHWLQPFVELERRVQNSESNVRLAYMELAEPSLNTVVSEACAAGFENIVVLPLFFAAGRHLRKDVPLQIDELTHRLQVKIRLLAPIGEHPLLSEAILSIVREAVQHVQDR